MAGTFTEAQKYLSGYLQALRKRGSVIPPEAEESYLGYLQALEALEAMTLRFATPAPDGACPPLSRQDRADLKAAYGQVMKTGSVCLSRIGGQDPLLAEPARMITVLNGRLLKDLNALNSVPAEETPSLPEVAEHSRALHLVLPDSAELRNVAGNSSSRTPVSYTDAAGKKRFGFFTPKKTVKPYMPELERRVEEIRAISPRFGQAMDRYIHHPPVASPLAAITQFSGAFANIDRRRMLKGFQDPGDPFTAEEIRAFTRNRKLMDRVLEFTKISFDLLKVETQYGVSLGLDLSRERRVDSRNAAMSSMAGLLGIPDLLADSVPATLTRNGVRVEGTFTEKAEGVDIRTMKPGDPAAGYLADRDPERAWLKDYFDLQILDFLCQNVDRHRQNMILQFDFADPANPRLMGLKGIDNDMAFGRLDPDADTDMLSRISDINHISASMKETVEALDPAMVRAALTGYGLQPDEIDAACERTRLLKEKLPRMHVVQDGEWRDIPQNVLKTDKRSKSYDVFDHLYHMNNPETLRLRNSQAEPEPVYAEGAAAEPFGRGTVPGVLARLEALDRLSYENQHWYLIHAKPQYGQMRRTVRKLKETLVRIGGEPTGEKLTELAKDLEELKLWAGGYLSVKGRPEGARAEGRVHAATELLNFAEEYLPAVYDHIAADQAQIGRRLSESAAAGRALIMGHLRGERAGVSALQDAFADLCMDSMLKQERRSAREARQQGPGTLELAMMKYGTRAVWKSLRKTQCVTAAEQALFPAGRPQNAELAAMLNPDDLGRDGIDRLAKTLLSGRDTPARIRELSANAVTRAITESGRSF